MARDGGGAMEMCARHLAAASAGAAAEMAGVVGGGEGMAHEGRVVFCDSREEPWLEGMEIPLGNGRRFWLKRESSGGSYVDDGWSLRVDPTVFIWLLFPEQCSVKGREQCSVRGNCSSTGVLEREGDRQL